MNLIGEKMLSEPLKELVYDMHQGINTVTEKVEYLSEGIPIIQSKHITKGYLHFNDAKFLSLEDYKKYHFKYQPQVDDLLVCNIGTIGKSLRVSEKNQFLIAWNLFLIKIKKEKLYSSFFAHYLNYLAHYKYFDRFLTGGTVKFINKKTMGNIPVPLPPLDQQKKIAAILDAADAYRQKTKALITKYDELNQSLFLDMFGDPVSNPKGWEIQCLSSVCSLQGGFSFKSKDFVENGVKLVKIGNVHFQNIIWDEVDLLPKEYLVKHSNFSLNEGDILMALTRPIIKSLGTVKAVTVKKSDLPSLLNQRVARFVPNESKIKKRYLLGYIYSNYFKNKIDKYSSTSLQPNVSNKQIEKMEIFVPPLEIQNQFTKRVQAIESQKALAQASLAQAEDLFNSLLQRAFKGELTS